MTFDRNKDPSKTTSFKDDKMTFIIIYKKIMNLAKDKV